MTQKMLLNGHSLKMGSHSLICVFFGRQKANDILLSHMITFWTTNKIGSWGELFSTVLLALLLMFGYAQACPRTGH